MRSGFPAGRLIPAISTLALPLILGACSILPDWLGESEAPPLPGQRVSVMALERQLEPDPRIADIDVRLPRPALNADWPQAGGSANHAMHHLALGDTPVVMWRADIGSSASSDERLTASPIVAQGRVFAMDARAQVTALAAANGERLWRVDLTPPGEESGAIGGGIAFDRGRLYVATAYGDVFALEPASGQQVWHRRIGIPIRAAPTADGNRVFAISYDNQIHALEAETGKVVWTHVGITESASLLGAASPAVEGGIVVAPFSSGELFALRADNGTVAWTEQLVRAGRLSPVGTINDINGRPVIDRGRVYAVGHSGRMAAIDLRTGERIWERAIAGMQSPWVAGDYIYVVTLNAEVVCLSARDGRVRWVQQLDRFRNPDSRRDKGLIVWYGPLLAGNRLILVSSHGQALSMSPYDGAVLGRQRLSSNANVPPVVANGVLYVLTDDANLAALK